METVDGSDHYSKVTDEPPPSLLTIILDTNPHAWALVAPTLPLSAAIANLLVFINAHLAFNNTNKVAIIASHTQRAEFLYPLAPEKAEAHTNGSAEQNGADSDVEMADGEEGSIDRSNPDDANHYRPFRLIQSTLLSAITRLITATAPSSLTPTTSIAGALTLALTYINKQTLALTTPSTSNAPPELSSDTNQQPPLNPRILILSVSGDLAHQYIPIMNTIFACQRLTIPIDICKIAGDTVFLQQASDATRGTYIALSHPQGLLQYLMMGFLPDQTSRSLGMPECKVTRLEHRDIQLRTTTAGSCTSTEMS
ncbi:transcription initiation factor TFIIH subunit 3, partial [Lecanoromycetidae sp. Uapishka_2]